MRRENAALKARMEEQMGMIEAAKSALLADVSGDGDRDVQEAAGRLGEESDVLFFLVPLPLSFLPSFILSFSLHTPACFSTIACIDNCNVQHHDRLSCPIPIE